MHTTRRRRPVSLPLLLALGLSVAATPLRAQRGLDGIADPQRRATLESVWRTLRDKGVGTNAAGVDWDAVLVRYAERAGLAKDDAEFYAVVNAMLGELKQSHCAAIGPGSKAASKTTETAPEETPASGRAGDAGVLVRAVDGVAMIVAVEPGSPAETAGVAPGSILRAIGSRDVDAPPAEGTPYRERVEWVYAVQGRLAGDVARTVRLRLADTADGPVREIEVGRAPMETASFGHLSGIPAGFTRRTLASNVEYFRLGSFFLPAFQAYQTAVQSIGTAPGLVLDLRGNPGGIGTFGPAVAGYLATERYAMGTSRMRDAELRFVVFPRSNAYAGPVAVLIDEASASTSEILAAGLQESKRARVFGRRTAGMVLPSVFHRLPDGGILQFPVADFQTASGRTLEGAGVEPDVAVDWTAEACRARRDPMLDAALAWLSTQLPSK